MMTRQFVGRKCNDGIVEVAIQVQVGKGALYEKENIMPECTAMCENGVLST